MKKIDVSKFLTLDEWEDTIDFVDASSSEFKSDQFVINKHNIKVLADIKGQIALNKGNPFDILDAFDEREVEEVQYCLPEEKKWRYGFDFTNPKFGHVKKIYTDATFNLMRSNSIGCDFFATNLSDFNYLIEVEKSRIASSKRAYITNLSFNPYKKKKKSELDSLKLPELIEIWDENIKNEWDKVGKSPRYALKLKS